MLLVFVRKQIIQKIETPSDFCLSYWSEFEPGFDPYATAITSANQASGFDAPPPDYNILNEYTGWLPDYEVEDRGISRIDSSWVVHLYLERATVLTDQDTNKDVLFSALTELGLPLSEGWALYGVHPWLEARSGFNPHSWN